NSKLVDARVWKGAQETVPLGLKSPLFITIPRGQYDQLKANVQMPERIMAPVAADAKLGSVQVKLGDKLLLEPSLSALQAVEEGSIWQRAIDSVKLYFE
ncbi:MAG: serine-type D-Ala-D-Ala carboxypeptidase, partial [Gammaproteobacteria bacterium]|nr:serine-type D-Ala-D-Ala carboxypeptidase [Gammaproteobacteria bacterium]